MDQKKKNDLGMVDGWMDVKAVLRIAFSKLKSNPTVQGWISKKLGVGRKAKSAPKIWEKMQKVERKAQMHDAKLE